MKLKTYSLKFLVLGSLVLPFAAQAFSLTEFFDAGYTAAVGAAPQLPGGLQCLADNGQPLPIMNQQVLVWKTSTQDQFMSRALVSGPIASIFPDRNGHTHFAINLNDDPAADLEVVYNEEFGALPPHLSNGMMVIACGDYITVGPQARLPSPMGGIIHWVHYNPGTRDGGRHKSGFLIINNQPYGIAPNNRNMSRY